MSQTTFEFGVWVYGSREDHSASVLINKRVRADSEHAARRAIMEEMHRSRRFVDRMETLSYS